MSEKQSIGVAGAGTMGVGIAQIAATAGHPVALFDSSAKNLEKAQSRLKEIQGRLVEKGRLRSEEANAILGRIGPVGRLEEFSRCAVVFEAIQENLEAKQNLVSRLGRIVSDEAVLATNTSSLSVTSVAFGSQGPDRVLGIHFFNPAPVMPLVEIIPGLDTSKEVVEGSRQLIEAWGKTTVIAKDTPGFIVNRVARPFYGEAIRILEEGVADASTIDWAMREIGGFRMGPFELMDLIGNDVNLKVTETVFEAFFYDPRFRPSLTQQRMVEAGRLGRKTGRGYYDYAEGATRPEPIRNEQLGTEIFFRILVMLINEAFDAVFMRIASSEDVDLAMTKGVNYPKGLLAWSQEIGHETVLRRIVELQEEYGEDRYRPNPLLRRMVRDEHEVFS